MAKQKMKARWEATVRYRLSAKKFDTETTQLEELVDLYNYVERGPHWDTIDKIEIRRINPDHPGLTIGQAERL